jgi:hypothetical protein
MREFFSQQDRWERRFARLLARLMGTQLNRLMDALGDPPDFDRLTPQFFDEHQAELQAAMTPQLESVFVDRVKQWIDEGPAIGVDWAMANEQAVEWSRRYTFDLVRELRGFTERGWDKITQQQRELIEQLQTSISEFYEDPENLRGLREKLIRYFGPSRAENIATTEVTRAAAMGDSEVLRQAGVGAPVYHPPAHPRCRGSMGLERLPNGEWVSVWLTREDERVCSQPLQTPWGTALGCRDLGEGGGRVLNQGRYLGMTFNDAEAMVRQEMAAQ